ncbi:MAG TPA: 50S ribosomal protein L21 [Candidatus Limnocylindrales bacterium]|jgi:large subunit ribosomal protein L21|nr:50S ribosomal protein L21 [Candidatus Limnocylindrales bacterium]
MYAVIETGGKQYRVELGSEIEVATLGAEPGQTIDFERVLLVADGDGATIGQPLVEKARVSASVVRHDRGEKIVVFKYRPKARRRVKHGHRQDLTLVRIADIVFDGHSAAKAAEAERAEQERERAEAARAAEKQAAADRALAEKLAREAEAERKQKAAEAAKQKRGKTETASTGSAKRPRSTGSAARKPPTKASGLKAGPSESGGRSRKTQAPEPAETKPTEKKPLEKKPARARTRTPRGGSGSTEST